MHAGSSVFRSILVVLRQYAIAWLGPIVSTNWTSVVALDTRIWAGFCWNQSRSSELEERHGAKNSRESSFHRNEFRPQWGL
ncbi:hypothetical protein B0H14DRAFT_3048992, partial [Mycena olivaceomarginata]